MYFKSGMEGAYRKSIGKGPYPGLCPCWELVVGPDNAVFASGHVLVDSDIWGFGLCQLPHLHLPKPSFLEAT